MPEAKQLQRRSRSSAKVRTGRQVKAAAHALNAELARAALAAAESDDADEPAEDSNLTVGELWLYGVVGGWWRGFDAESVANAIRGMGDIDVLYVRIHSPGGRASEGVAIANLLRNLKARVVTVVDGYACSAASVIAVAGDEVVMCPGGQLMLHDASTGLCVWGDAEWLRSQVPELQRVADWIDGQSQNYAGIYAYKAGNTPEHWRQEMTVNGQMGKWYTGEEAVAAKLADRVGTITAVGSPPVVPEDEIDDDDEEMLAKVAHDLQLLDECLQPAALATWIGEPPKPPTASADGPTPPKEGSTPVTRISDAGATTIGQKLGVAEDADEATILAALDEALDQRGDEQTPAIPDGHVVVPQARLDDLEKGSAAGLAAQQKLHDQEREAFLEANKAKFSADNRQKWSDEYDRNPEATTALFEAAADLIPVSEHGHSVDSDDTAADGKSAVETVRESEAYQNWSFS